MEENEKITCTYCGVIIEDENDMIEIDGNVYCGEDCANMDDYYQCADCGEWFNYANSGIQAYGDYICDNCRDNYYYCDSCEEYFCEDDIHYIDRTGEYLCDSCYEEYRGSRDCNEPDNEIFFEYHEWNGDWIPRYTLKDLIETREKHKDALKNYTTYKEKRDYLVRQMLTIGFELETENTNENIDRIGYCEELQDIFGDFVHFEQDGSLQDGVEIISQPFTLNYLHENENMFKNGLKRARELGYTSHNNGRCGLHFHINRNYFGANSNEDVNKLNLFFETYKENIQNFSRRNDYHYCYFLSDEKELNDMQRLSLKVLDRYKDADRYLVVNNNNYRTVEIRVMRGTLAFTTFMASAEFVFSLAKVVENADKVSQISWHKVVDTKDAKYIQNYIKERNIRNSIKFLVDKTKDVQKEDMQKVENLFKYIESFNNGDKVIDFDTINSEIKDFRLSLSKQVIENNDIDALRNELNKLETLNDTTGVITNDIDRLKNIKNVYSRKSTQFEQAKDLLQRIYWSITRYTDRLNTTTNAINFNKLQELETYANTRLLIGVED